MKRNILLTLITGSLAASCTLSDPRLVIPSSDVITLEAVDKDLNKLSNTSLPADSLSHALIVVNLGKQSNANLPIILRTTNGVLTNVGQSPTSSSTSTLTITPQDRQIVVQLNSLDVANDNVVISGTVNNVSAVTVFSFTTAYATDFTVDPVNKSVGKTDTVTISITAKTMQGTMSENQYCTVSVTSADGIVSNYPGLVSISNQKGKFSITNVLGKVGKITATISLKTGVSTNQTKNVEINYN
jgi:hypothetical protein